jgi:hypothetical protein
MKNKPNFLQIDNKVESVFGIDGVEVMASPAAWEKYIWAREFFGAKPKEGYFVWVKKQVDFPLSTCVTMASQGVAQNLNNLLVIEKGIRAKVNVACNAKIPTLHGIHKATGKMILKEGASLDYDHIHSWGREDFVSPDYEFRLGKDAKLTYSYKNFLPPKNLELKTAIHCDKGSSLNLNFVINSLNSKIRVEDSVYLEGKDSQGIVRLRLLGREKSDIEAISRIFAIAPSRGHLDCQGLLIDKTAKISLIPQLVCQNKESQITHEASLGKISEEELIYLRMRGLSEKEATNLIVSGFLSL